MYPKLKYNDLNYRDWLPHVRLTGSRQLMRSMFTVKSAAKAQRSHHASLVVDDSLTSTAVPQASTRLMQRRKARSGSIPLPEQEEKQSARD